MTIKIRINTKFTIKSILKVQIQTWIKIRIKIKIKINIIIFIIISPDENYDYSKNMDKKWKGRKEQISVENQCKTHLKN